MASQLFCLALLAVSAFGYDLTSSQQYPPLQNYPSQSYGLYNQQSAGSMQGELPYMNYIRQKQNYYLPYLAHKMQFIPAHAQQFIPQLGMPTGVEGQVNTPVNQLLLNREQTTDVPQVIASHEKRSKVHSKKDKHSSVHVPLNQVRPEEQQQQQQQQQPQQQQESLLNYRELVNERQVQDNTVLSQIRDVNQRTNLPVQDNTVLSQIRDVDQRTNLPVQDNIFASQIRDANQRVNLPVQENTLPYQVRDVNQRMNILGNTEGLLRSYPEVRDVNQMTNMPVQGLLRPTVGVNEVRDVNQRLNILENTEGLIRSYPEILDICQRINMPVHAVNAIRDVNQILNIFGNTEGLIRSYPEIRDVCQRIDVLVQGLVYPTLEVTDVNQRMNLPVQGLVRPTFEASELFQRMPLVQSNIDGTLRYNNVLAPRFQSPYQYQYQPLSQVYPARQNILSLLGLTSARPVMQYTVDPTQQVVQPNLPTYFGNNADFARNNLNVERNLVY